MWWLKKHYFNVDCYQLESGGWKTPWTGQMAHVKMSLSWTVYDELCISTELWCPLLYPHSSAYNYSSVFVCCSTLIKSPQWVMQLRNWPGIYTWLNNWMNTICLRKGCYVQFFVLFIIIIFFFSAMFKECRFGILKEWDACCCRLGTSLSTLCTPCHVPRRLAFLLSSMNILLLMSSSRSWFDRNSCHFFFSTVCRKLLQ